MENNSKIDYVRYRRDRAYETFEEIPKLISEKMLANAMNRIYYSGFYITSALALYEFLADMKAKTFLILKIFIISIILSGCAAEIRIDHSLKISGNDWDNYCGNIQRTNESKYSLTLPLDMIWEYSGDAGPSPFSPIIIDSMIFVGFLNGDIHALKLSTGKKFGNLNVESAVQAGLLIDRNTIYVPLSHNENSLRAYDMIDGRWKWKKKITGIESSPLLIGRNIYTATLSGEVHCIDKSNGNTLWQYSAPKSIHSSIASDSVRLIFGCDDGYLYAINLSDGKYLWKYYTGGAIFSTPLIYSGRVFIGSDDGQFYCLNIQTGLSIWNYNSEAPIKSGAAISDSNVYFVSLNGQLFSANISTGSINWTFRAASVLNTPPTIAGNYLLVSSFDKKIYILDKITGEKKWEFEAEGRMKTSPVFCGKYLIICFENTGIIAFKSRD